MYSMNKWVSEWMIQWMNDCERKYKLTNQQWIIYPWVEATEEQRSDFKRELGLKEE